MSGTQQRFDRSLLRFIFSAILLAWLQKGAGADKPAANSLENYLRKLGYAPIEFRYDKNQNQPTVEGELNGKKCPFMVDSGCSVSCIDPSAASGLKTLREMGVTVDEPILSSLPPDSVVVMDKLALGGSQFMSQPIKLEKLEMDYKRISYRGVLGFDFLLRNFALLDCAGRKLYVRAEKPTDQLSKALTETLHRSGFTNVALQGEAYFTVSALVNGLPVELLVDSGASLSTIDESERKRLSLEMIKEQQIGSYIPQELGQKEGAIMIGGGKVGAHRMRAVRLKSLQIGGTDWNSLNFAMVDLSAWGIADAEGKKRFNGMLGPDSLGPQGALIDFSSRTLWFSLPKKRPQR